MDLEKIRKQKGKTQKDIAKVIGISQSNYSKYEIGTTEPNIETIIKLAKYFNVTTDELLGVNKEEVALTEKNNLLKKIDKLTEIECYKLNIFADGLISNRNENEKPKNNKMIIIKEEE